MPDSVRNYYQLTKPGIIRGNLLHLLAGTLLAYGYGIELPSFIGVLIGTTLVIASACVLNNYIDRDIDAKMKRTRRRASVTGAVSVRHAMIFACILAVLGFGLLIGLTNMLVFLIGLIAYIFYVLIYAVAKRKTVHSTLIGAIPGALPAMAGYVAISGRIDEAAWLLFLLVVCWQMPHFYAISLFRRSEYEAANIPVLGVVAPYRVVKRYILAYMLTYLALVMLIIIANVFSVAAGLLLVAGAIYWLYVFFSAKGGPEAWARSVFYASLTLTILLLLATILNIFTANGSTLQY